MLKVAPTKLTIIGPTLLGVALVVLGIIGFASYNDWQGLQQATVESTEARNIRRVTELLLSVIKDAETGQRGFLLTGDSQYLAPYNSALSAIPNLLSSFAVITKEFPDQAERVERLKQLTQQKLAELKHTIEIQSSQGPEAALRIVNTDEGIKSMDAVRAICAEISGAQSDRVASRTKEIAARSDQLRFIAGAGSLVLFLIILLATVIINAANTRQARLNAELENSNGMLKTTLVSIGDAVITTDADGKISLLNRVAQTMTGWSQEEAQGKPLDVVFHIVNEHTRAVVESPVAKVLREGRIVGLANHTVLLARDGREIPIDDSGAPIKDAAGALLGVVLVFRDITDRKMAEDSLASSNAKIRDVLESITDGFLALDQNWHFEYVNTAAEQILGQPKDQIVGEHIWQRFPELSNSVVEANLRRVAADRTAAHFDSFYPSRNAWFEFHAYPSAEGGIAVYLSDVSERKRSEEAVKRSEQALRDSEARFRTALQTISDLVWTNDASGQMVGEQPGWAGFTGQSYDAYQGYGWSQAVHPDDAQPTVDEWNRCVAARGQFVFEHRVRRFDGVYRLFSIRALPVLNDDGSIREWVGVHTDITDRRAAEAEISTANAQLRRSNADLEQFAYAASHDLQEPLRMVSIYSQMLKKKYEGKIDAEADTFIGFAVDGARRMDHLLRDLLAYSHATSAMLEPQTGTKADVALQKALINLNAAIRDSGASLTHTDLPTVYMAEIHLVQLFQNLVSNAIKYRGGSAPFIHIGCEKNGSEWIFSVQDNGMGIEAEYLKQVFGVFKRLHGQQYPGTGIGLAICQRIVDRYSGRIWVESEPGRGSTFLFTVPLEYRTNE